MGNMCCGVSNKQTALCRSRNFGIHSLSLLKSAGGVKLGTGTAWFVTKREIFVLLTPCRASRECGIIFARLFGSSSLEQMFFCRI